jgi:hypothetical protein
MYVGMVVVLHICREVQGRWANKTWIAQEKSFRLSQFHVRGRFQSRYVEWVAMSCRDYANLYLRHVDSSRLNSVNLLLQNETLFSAWLHPKLGTHESNE